MVGGPYRAVFGSSSTQGRAEGIRLLFTFRWRLVLLPVLPYPVFALLVSSPSPVGVGGIGRLVGYIVGRCHRDLVSRPSVSFYPFRSCDSFDFPRIGLRTNVMRRFCQLIFLRCSVAEGRIVFSIVSSLFSSPRLVGRLVAILCGSPVVSSCSSMRPASRQAIRSRFARASRSSDRRASRPAVRFPVLFIVPRCFALLGSSFPVSSLVLSACLVKQFVFSRFARRLVSRLVVSGRVLRFVLFCSHLICPLRLVVVMTAAARHSHIMAACSRPPLPPVVESDLGMAAAE